MNHTGQAIRDAAEKGGYGYRWWKANDLEDDEGYNALPMRALTEHLQDPEFWKGLGRARDWQDTGAWLFHWHRFIDHIAFGHDPDSVPAITGSARCARESSMCFASFKCQFGYPNVRYRGIAKNGADVFSLLALANLYLPRRTFASPDDTKPSAAARHFELPALTKKLSPKPQTIASLR